MAKEFTNFFINTSLLRKQVYLCPFHTFSKAFLRRNLPHCLMTMSYPSFSINSHLIHPTAKCTYAPPSKYIMPCLKKGHFALSIPTLAPKACPFKISDIHAGKYGPVSP